MTLYGTIVISSETSPNLRPMKRLMEKIVFSGLVTCWRFAGTPTSRSPPCVKATTDGVVRPPSRFGITVGSPPSSTAMQELVVPRSIPIVLAMFRLPPERRDWAARWEPAVPRIKKSKSGYSRMRRFRRFTGHSSAGSQFSGDFSAREALHADRLASRSDSPEQSHPPPGDTEPACQQAAEGLVRPALDRRRREPHDQDAVAFAH